MAVRRWRWLAAGAGAAALGITLTLQLTASGLPGVRLSSSPLGVNVAPWDGVYAGSGSGVIQPLLSAAGIRQLRYGGGSFADLYDWQTDTSIGGCLPANPHASFTSWCAWKNPLDFSQFSLQARAIGADSFVTVNYGSGSPAAAAAWVTAAADTTGEDVTLWEVGNETYGCWEVDNELSGPPDYYQGYRPAMGSASAQDHTCPTATEGPSRGVRTLATSYAANVLPFLQAIKAADPKARIGVPWAFSADIPGASAADTAVWNNTVLGTDGAYVGFVDAHYYPFAFSGATGGANPSDSQVLQALRTIPSLQASIRAGLAAHDPGAAVVIGETAVSSGETTTACTPVGALFAAGDALSWLAAGAQSVDWWDMNNYGNSGSSCTKQDFGLFTSGARPLPETPYYGYLLASKLAQPGAQLGFMTTSDPADVLAYQSALPGGRHAVAFINLDTRAPHTVTFSAPAGLTGTVRSLTYSAGTQNAAQSKVVTGTASAVSAASSGIALPAESITVLETQ